MFSFTSLALAVSAVSYASALVVPRATPPPTWDTDYLEPYTTYHVRYLAIGCQNQHGKPFFDQCCHPLLATEKLEINRPKQCIPSVSASSSASAIEPTSTVIPDDGDDDDEDCDEDEDDNEPTIPVVVLPTNPPVAIPTKAPVTSHVHAAKPTPTKAPTPPKASPTSAPQSNTSSDTHTGGFATFYEQHNTAGACGTVHSDNDLIAAMDSRQYGNTGVRSPLCGKKVRINNPKNGKSVTVTIADACPTCENKESIDLSKGAFEQIATFEQGMVGITWSFV